MDLCGWEWDGWRVLQDYGPAGGLPWPPQDEEHPLLLAFKPAGNSAAATALNGLCSNPRVAIQVFQDFLKETQQIPAILPALTEAIGNCELRKGPQMRSRDKGPEAVLLKALENLQQDRLLWHGHYPALAKLLNALHFFHQSPPWKRELLNFPRELEEQLVLT